MTDGRPDDARPDEPAAQGDDAAADDRTVAAEDLDAVLGQFGDEPADDRTVAADGVVPDDRVGEASDDTVGAGPDDTVGVAPGTDAELDAVLQRFGDEPADDRTMAADGPVTRGPGNTSAAESLQDRTDPDEASVWRRATGSSPADVDVPEAPPEDDEATSPTTEAPAGTGTADTWAPSSPGTVPPAPVRPDPTGNPSGAGDLAAPTPETPPAPVPDSASDSGPGRPVLPPAPPMGDTTMPPAPGFDPGSAEQRWRPPSRTREVIEPGASTSWPVWLIPIVVIVAIAAIIALFLLS